jgi:hypothetical protein
LLLIMTQVVIPLPVVFKLTSGAGAAGQVEAAES